MSEATPTEAPAGDPDPLNAAPLSCLVGPTAVGKTVLALRVAERAGAEIVSLDSMLVYRGMDVGTAKPSAAERARVAHHLIDCADPHERYDVQRYLAEARAAVAEIRARGRRALFVGGTGLYLKALVFGLFDGPPFDPERRRALEERARREGGEVLHAELAAVDRAAAARLHPRDVRRVVRALEVFEGTGRTLSDWQRQWGRGRRGRARVLVGLELEPQVLEARIRARARAMLDAGWAEEARAIRDARGFGPSAVQALGYREVLRHVDGELERGELEELVALRTRQFARRQRTWFRHFPEIRWLRAPQREDELDRAATEVLAAFSWEAGGGGKSAGCETAGDGEREIPIREVPPRGVYGRSTSNSDGGSGSSPS